MYTFPGANGGAISTGERPVAQIKLLRIFAQSTSKNTPAVSHSRNWCLLGRYFLTSGVNRIVLYFAVKELMAFEWRSFRNLFGS